MAEGYKDFTAGSTLAAADLEDNCQNQSVMRFADSSARATALSSVKTEGMMSFLKDVNSLGVFVTGTTWSTIGPVHGALTSWTPTVTQLGSVTVTNTRSTYQRVGRLVHLNFLLAVTGSGTGSNDIVIGGLPFTAVASSAAYGGGFVFDSSGPAEYPALLFLATTTTLKFKAMANNTSPSNLGSATFTAGLASGDTVSGSISYEAAADA